MDNVKNATKVFKKEEKNVYVTENEESKLDQDNSSISSSDEDQAKGIISSFISMGVIKKNELLNKITSSDS